MYKSKLLWAVICLLALFLALAGCGAGEVSGPAEEPIVVSFNSDGGSPVEALTLAPDQPLDLPDQPVREGYAFGGWVLEGDGSRVGSGHTFPAGTGAVILRALWKEVQPDPAATETAGPETAAADAGGSTGTAESDSSPEDTAPDNCYTVIFDSRGGSAVPSQTIPAGEPLYLGTNPTREGYTFVTWEDEWGMPIGHGEEHTYVDWYTEAGWEITLYAVWN